MFLNIPPYVSIYLENSTPSLKKNHPEITPSRRQIKLFLITCDTPQQRNIVRNLEAIQWASNIQQTWKIHAISTEDHVLLYFLEHESAKLWPTI